MKLSVFIFAILLNVSLTDAQPKTIYNLTQKLNASTTDAARLSALDSLAMFYLFFSTKPDSAFYYINESVNTSFRADDKKYLILSYSRMGFYFILTSQYKAAMDITLKGIDLSEEYHITDYLSTLDYNLSWIYTSLKNYDLVLKYAYAAKSQLTNSKDPFFDQSVHVFGQIGTAYLQTGKKDSALYYFKLLDSQASVSKELAAKEISDWYLGMYYSVMKNYSSADSLFLNCIERCKKNNDYRILSACPISLTHSLIQQGRIPNAIVMARFALEINKTINEKAQTAGAARLLYKCHDILGHRDSAFYYLKLSDGMSSAVMNAEISSQMQQINFNQQLRQKEKEANQNLENEKNRRKLISYVFVTGIIFLLLIAAILWRNNKHKQKANALLQGQKEKIESTLTELKATQSQLIQSEKMASLGELTAGIAHEIQNPLNFVNNFSEVNTELIEELKAESLKPTADRNEKQEVELLNDIAENEKKINHHGKRADAIVKGMLQHSRSSSGTKEPTDINALCDEYLRLSYHGLRAKDKSFNAKFETEFDQSLPKINIVPQEIGRVVLNLINNAFYAVSEKTKLQAAGYEPQVVVTTKKDGDNKILILVKDNGNGIPQNIVDKIFQPFFTTKPTGQGTGLGLSLSYDIVKAHGGEIKVESNDGAGSEFMITLWA